MAEFGGGVDGVDPAGKTDTSGGGGWGCIRIVVVLFVYIVIFVSVWVIFLLIFLLGNVVVRHGRIKGRGRSYQCSNIRRVLHLVYTPRAENRRPVASVVRVLHHPQGFIHLHCILRHLGELVQIVTCVGHAGAGGDASRADGEVCACRGGCGGGRFGGVNEGVAGDVCDV